MPSRHDQIADFYANNSTDLVRAVRRAISGSDALVEDACQQAWCQLLRNERVTLDRQGFSWLYVVACREAYRLSQRSRREPALGEPADLPQRTLSAEASGIDGLGEMQDRRALVAELPGRQARMLFLQAAGFDYAEIARMTGDSVRTVERQLMRARRTLRRLDLERVG